jgi:hypothetical protein
MIDVRIWFVVSVEIWFVLGLVWIPRVGFIQLFSMGFRFRLLFHFSSSSALQLIVRPFIYGIPFFQHSLSTFHGRPLSSSHHAKIRQSLACVSSFFDLRKPQSGATHGHRLRSTRLFFWSHCLEIPFGAFAWSMVIDWSIFWNMFR